ncbi:MAG TPA: hypothetical protein VMF91_13775 [Bryobacteraceae bacterium]|nr:hypothetical protein [Bryobacteraceae bacterium]
MAPDVFVHLLFRFIHIASVILLLGGVVYARWVLVPTLNALPEDIRKRAARDAQERYRTTLFVLLILIVGSGLYNFFTGPKHGQTYQIWFGVKMLLVAHIVASAILWATSPYGDVTVDGRSKRRLVSIAISGLLVVLISAYLRSLTQRGL